MLSWFLVLDVQIAVSMETGNQALLSRRLTIPPILDWIPSWFSPSFFHTSLSFLPPSSQRQLCLCPWQGCVPTCCQRVQSQTHKEVPCMTTKILRIKIISDSCTIPKERKGRLCLRQNALIHCISKLPELSKSVFTFVRSRNKVKHTGEGTSTEKLVLN